MDKKGQVTVFIIVGIIILAIAAVVLYVTSVTVSEEIETEGRPITETVPQEFIAIQEYTETCLNSVAKQGVIILGQQGGYLYPSSLGDYSITNPTDSIGVNLDPVLVPFWHYNANPNGDPEVVIATLQPALHDEDESLAGGSYMSIESQLGRYVEEEIEQCLNNYQVFAGQGFIINYDEKDVNARVWDGHVDFILEMPLEATREEASAEMTTFYADLDVNLKHVYEVAADITDAEQNYTFLENQAIDLLLVHTGEEITKFAPFHGVGFNDHNYLVWTAEDLKRKMKTLLSSYIGLTRYYNSNNFYRFEYPQDSLTADLTQKVTDNMILPLSGGEDLDVTFDYFGWDIYFDVNGGQQEITPSEIFVDIPGPVGQPLVFQQYYNSYDFSYPVLVTLNDPESFDGKGYTFNFALESNVINNKPIDADYVQPETLIDSAQSLVCDKDHFDTGLLRSIVVDAYTHEPIEMVKVGFMLPDTDYCTMGTTDDDGTLETNYPTVYGGVMDFHSADYLRTYLPVDTYPYKEVDGIIGLAVEGLDYEVIYMYEKKLVNANVMKKNLEKCIVPKVCNLDKDKCEDYADRKCFFNSGNGLFLPENPAWEILANGSMTYLNEFYFIDSAKKLEFDEKVVFSLERISSVDESPFVNEDFSAHFVVEGEQTAEVELVPGIYEVSVQFIKDDTLTFPEDERCSGAKKKKDCSNITESSISTLLSSMEWTTEKTYLTITEDDLYNSDTVTFYALATNLHNVPQTVESYDENNNDVTVNALVMEDLGMMGFTSNISQLVNVRRGLEPKWSSSLEEGVE